MPTLLLRLNAPLQSWGASSLYDNRETDDMPTKSGILGMIGAALGRKRYESVEDLVHLQFGVRIDAPGRRMRDFQITEMGAKLNANLSTRVYLCDATFLAGLYSESREELEKIENAMRNPVFSLFLGRRSCPPTVPLVLGIREKELYNALLEEEWLLPVRLQEKMQKTQEHVRLRIVAETMGEEGNAVKRDVPVSFSPFRREYAYRSIKEMPGKEITTEQFLQSTEHDAFGEVG